MSKPLSDERLTQIRGRLANLAEIRDAAREDDMPAFSGLTPEQLCGIALAFEQDVPALLAEVERLRALVGLHEQALGWAKDVRDFEVNYVSGERESYKQLWENAHAESAAMREIVRQVADADTYVWGLALPVHPKDADKLKAKARALVAQWDKQGDIHD